jgi:DNA-binding CsgD family transcriptional regulator/putative methionine-R-sulfoxide reductase with GAF domain
MREVAPSARNLRSRYRDEERNLARLRLLIASGQRLQERSAMKQFFPGALQDLLAFLAMDSGVVLVSYGGALRVAAAVGQAPPAGAQLASQGALAIALRQSKVMVRRDVTSTLLVARDRKVSLELLVPAVCDGQIVGLLGATSRSSALPPDPADLQTLEALGGLTGTAIRLFDEPPPSRHTPSDAGIADLTPREQQVFALLPRGHTNATMAKQLGIAPGTVKVHVERILGKLRLRDRTQAAVKAARMGYGDGE